MKYTINLASRSYVNKKTLYLAYLLCGVVLVVGLFYTLGYYFELQKQIDTTENRLAELEEKILASQGGDADDYSVARYEKVLAEIELANEILDRDSFRWTVLLDQLEQVVPGNVRILSISPDHDSNTVELSCVAKNLKDMKRFLDNLIKSEVYEDVLLLGQASEKSASGDAGISFTIELLGAF
jgi:type IV pilus assembly protein PilN